MITRSSRTVLGWWAAGDIIIGVIVGGGGETQDILKLTLGAEKIVYVGKWTMMSENG